MTKRGKFRVSKYEEELYGSEDPEDKLELVTRLLLKKREIDPDTECVGVDFLIHEGDK